MRKSTAVIAFASLMFSASSFAASGTSGTSGSAGLGIDLSGLTVASTSAPYAALTGGEGSLGGPITGLAKWALKRN
jgi:hypothetical protein